MQFNESLKLELVTTYDKIDDDGSFCSSRKSIGIAEKR